MAKYGKTLAQVVLEINGQKQVQNIIDGMQKSAEKLKGEITALNEKLRELAEDPTKSAEYDATNRELKGKQKELKQIERSLNETKKLNLDINDVLEHMSEYSASTLNNVRRRIEATLRSMKHLGKKERQQMREMQADLKMLTDEISRRKGGLIEFEDIMDSITHVDDRSLEAVIKRLKDLIATTDKLDAEKLKQYKEQLATAEGVQQRRAFNEGQSIIRQVQSGSYKNSIAGTEADIKALEKYMKLLNTADTTALKEVSDAIKQMNADLDEFTKKQSRETLTTNLMTSGTADIKQAVDWLTKYQGTLEPLSQEWQEVNKEIEAGNARLKQLSDRVKNDAMSEQFKKLSTLSTNALDEQQKYWQSVLNNAEKGTAAYIQAERKLQAISQEVNARRDAQAGAVMGDLANHSVAEIQEAIKATEQLRDAQKAGSNEYNIYNEEIKKAKEYLQSYVDLNKQVDMEGKWANLTTLSAGALAEQKKYWQEMVNGAQNGSKELQEYQNRLKAVTDEESRRAENKYFSIANNPDQYSTAEVEEAVKVFQKLRDEQQMGSSQWQWYADLVNKATDQLAKFKDEAKMKVMTDQFANLKDLSVNALAEQKKYWKEVYDNAQAGTAAYSDAWDKLVEIRKLEESRTKRDAQMDIAAAKSGNWNRTIEDTEKAIKLIEEYKKQLHVKTDAAAITEANEAITTLNQNLGKAKESLMDVNDALAIGEQVEGGTFDGTTEEILRAKKALEEYRKTLKMKTDAKEIKKVDEALRGLGSSAANAGKSVKDLDAILGDLDHASVDELQAAAKQLQEELQGATRGIKDYETTAAKLRQVNLELKKAKKEWEGQENVITRTAKRLAAYVAVYGGYNFIAGKIQEAFQANLQLSDSMADVQKTTGLAAEEVAKLGKEIDSIDTRTSQQQLYELAAAAGQIGLKSENEILGFVKAANMITVSLNELGTEGTTQLMKIATLTGEAAEGTEKALMSIGSAINELTAASAATAGPIVDLMNRMGGVAAQSGLTSAQMAAIGATADALGQSIEVTGTSMNKFITTLMSSSDQIAYALNMDAKALRSLLNEGKTMEAMIAIFERMNSMGGLGNLAAVMGDLGSEGARMTQVLAALAERVDFLKGQVNLSTEAYEQATSIQTEYNVKNENAIAILQRMGNAIREVFVNSGIVQSITSILRSLYQFFSWLSEGAAGARLFTSALLGLTAALVAARLEWVKTVQAMSGIDMLRALVLWFKNAAAGAAALGTSIKNLGKAFKANWLTLLIGLLTSAAYWFIKTANYVSEAAKATAKYNRELQEETDKVDTLFNSLTRLNNKEEDRARIINQINEQYSTYLGFMLDEKDSAEKLAAAHQLINAELRKRMALNLQNTLQGSATTTYAEAYEKAMTDIGKDVEGMTDKSVQTTEVMRVVSQMINERVAAAVTISEDGKRKVEDIDMESFLNDVRDKLSEEFDREIISETTGKKATVKVGEDLYNEIDGTIENLLKARVDFQKKSIIAEQQANIEITSITKDALEARKKMINQLESDFKKSEELDVNTMSEQQQREHYQKMVDNANDYVDATSKLLKENASALTESEKKQYNEQIDFFRNKAKEVAKLAPGLDPWGKNRDVKDWKEFVDIVTNLDTSSATALAAAYKKLKEESANIPTDVGQFNIMFGTKFESDKDAAEKVHQWAEDIKRTLKEKYGRNTSLDFIFDSGGGGGKKPKDEYEAALASLEAYYNDREEMVRKNALLEEKTEEELNKDLRALENEHLSARVELRRLMLSKENEFLTTFSHVAESEYMRGIDYNKLQTQLGKFGKAMAQGLEKNLTADLVLLQKYAWEHNKEISRILLENDPVKKVALEYQESFEKIDLFWAADEKVTEEAARHKMATLLEFSAKRAELTDEELKEQLKKSKEFGDVVKGMLPQEYQAFLILLDQYAEAATTAKRQATQKAIRNLEFNFDNSDMGKQVSGQLQNIDELEKQLGELNSAGVMLEATSLEQQRELVMQRIFLEQYKWEEMIKAEQNGMNRQDVLRELQLQKEKAQYESRVELVKLISQQDENMFNESNQRIEQMVSWGVISDIEGTERQQELVRAQLALQQERIDEQIRLEEQGLARQEVIDNLRLARQNALYKADRKLTELTMQEYQQRAQVAQEWGTAIGTGLGEMIAGTEDAGKNLVKNLATMAVQSIGQMAQMYVAKRLLLSQQNMSEAAAAMTTATTAAAEATAVGAAKTAEATAIAMATPDSVMTFGASGAAKAAVISGLIAAAVAASIAIINSLFPGAGKTAEAKNRKLSTGMLTYAEGNYPVLGNDGKVYDAKYEGSNIKTGIYGGGAHFGIFSEKQPEMIVDGKTTQKLILNYPYIYDAITTIAKNGRLVNAMPTFASGDYPAGMRQIAQVEAVDMSGGASEQMLVMQEELAQSREVNRRLLKVLEGGLVAHVDGLENYKQQKKNERFLKRRGID